MECLWSRRCAESISCRWPGWRGGVVALRIGVVNLASRADLGHSRFTHHPTFRPTRTHRTDRHRCLLTTKRLQLGRKGRSRLQSTSRTRPKNRRLSPCHRQHLHSMRGANDHVVWCTATPVSNCPDRELSAVALPASYGRVHTVATTKRAVPRSSSSAVSVDGKPQSLSP